MPILSLEEVAEAELLRPKSRPLGVIIGEVVNNRKATMGIMKETSKKPTGVVLRNVKT